jgi:hypothetical protein
VRAAAPSNGRNDFAEFTHASTTHARCCTGNSRNDFVEFTHAPLATHARCCTGNGRNDFVEFTHANTTHVLLHPATAATILRNLPTLHWQLTHAAAPATAGTILRNLPTLTQLTRCCARQQLQRFCGIYPR